MKMSLGIRLVHVWLSYRKILTLTQFISHQIQNKSFMTSREEKKLLRNGTSRIDRL